MSLTLGVLKETVPGECRVALVPEIAAKFKSADAHLLMERGAGALAQFPDESYQDVEFADSAQTVLNRADLLLKVQPPTLDEVVQMKPGATLVCFMYGHLRPDIVKALRDRQMTVLATELVPRISRAQSMDALSSQAAVAGYKAVLIAANTLDKFLPMLTTAAGTIRPAQVLVIGAGVAGLQAIATAKRLGAVVEAYDVRSATREQVKSLGAKFVETGVSAEGQGGYARELTQAEKDQQQAVLENRIAAVDAVITTAAIPGRPAPRLIRKEAVYGMKPGAVIVDIAAETGGNCELTQPGETVLINGVKIVGPLNLASSLSYHASEMYSRNLYNLVKPALNDGAFNIDWNDEVFAGCALTHAGTIRHEPTRKLIEG
ncbi:MAG: Re/Si-specific NAD(P)(+) transhydrogenase subunit alpha [Steroidobacteraceae bacterium]